MTEIHAETVLIYRDGHAEEVEDYAIVGKTIWVFNEARAKKIPLADLDLPATKRDNERSRYRLVLLPLLAEPVGSCPMKQRGYLSDSP